MTASTTYHFQVASADSANNVATSSDLTLTTAAVPDTTPPAISSVVETQSTSRSRPASRAYAGQISAPAPIVQQNGANTTPITLPNPTMPTASSVNQTSFTRDIYFGLSGEDVRLLQKFLNDHQFIVAKTGAGSPGFESNYFGPKTRDALIRFQIYNHITPAHGYFGPKTLKIVGNQQ